MAKDEGSIRITTAASSRNEDISARQRRYLLSMSLRTICFVGAVVATGWLRWVLVAGAILLPYVAVVMANAVATKSDGFDLTDGLSDQPMLPGPTESEGQGRSDNI